MKLLKYIYSISLIGWTVFLSAIVLFGNSKDPSIDRFPYLYEKHNYESFMEVIDVLFNLDNYNLSFFDWCCDCINYIGHSIGYNYEIINILIFVIILPGIFINLLFIAFIQFLVLRKLRV
jgi:hypothetical protein